MANFIELGNTFLNLDHIVSVQVQDVLGGRTDIRTGKVYLSTGTTYDLKEPDLDTLLQELTKAGKL